MSPVLQRGFRLADLLRSQSRKARTFCKHLLWSLLSKQMRWSSHVLETLLYLPKHLHSVCSASGSKVAIKGTLNLAPVAFSLSSEKLNHVLYFHWQWNTSQAWKHTGFYTLPSPHHTGIFQTPSQMNTRLHSLWWASLHPAMHLLFTI